jgi:hypothetical protein
MRWILATTSFCFVVALAVGGSGTASGQTLDPETKAKLEAIKKQVDSLQKKVDDLRAQEQKLLLDAKKKAEEKEYYNKVFVDIKGRLSRETLVGKEVWAVSTSNMKWYLDLGGKKEWNDLAKQHEGKTVMVTGGAVPTTTSYGYPGTYPGPGGYPYPGPGGNPYPGPGYYGYPYGYGSTTWMVTVETFKAP